MQSHLPVLFTPMMRLKTPQGLTLANNQPNKIKYKYAVVYSWGKIESLRRVER